MLRTTRPGRLMMEAEDHLPIDPRLHCTWFGRLTTALRARIRRCVKCTRVPYVLECSYFFIFSRSVERVRLGRSSKLTSISLSTGCSAHHCAQKNSWMIWCRHHSRRSLEGYDDLYPQICPLRSQSDTGDQVLTVRILRGRRKEDNLTSA